MIIFRISLPIYFFFFKLSKKIDIKFLKILLIVVISYFSEVMVVILSKYSYTWKKIQVANTLFYCLSKYTNIEIDFKHEIIWSVESSTKQQLYKKKTLIANNQSLVLEKRGTQRCASVATCNLNQWSLDFDGNLSRIMESIRIAKSNNCRLRVGPELEVSGYGCEDHFLEEDTMFHCWQSIEAVIESGITKDILCCFGMPVTHNSVCYNCGVWICNNQIVLIRPKMHLANDGNYREPRYFTAWSKQFGELEKYVLPLSIQKLTKQSTVPIGPGIIQLTDASVASETCEELFTPLSPFIHYALNGVDIVCNSSGSHHNLRKLDVRLDLMRNSSRRCGGVYLYANQQGCDGNRLYYDGCAMILNNGDLIKQ
ncbi:hypothetical protein RFI_15675, partial [Reticulomyxa filosa]